LSREVNKGTLLAALGNCNFDAVAGALGEKGL
jgi:hypothetical protein